MSLSSKVCTQRHLKLEPFSGWLFMRQVFRKEGRDFFSRLFPPLFIYVFTVSAKLMRSRDVGRRDKINMAMAHAQKLHSINPLFRSLFVLCWDPYLIESSGWDPKGKGKTLFTSLLILLLIKVLNYTFCFGGFCRFRR